MLSNTDYKYFEKAKQIATISDYHPVQVGCIAVYQGIVVSMACNLQKTHPIQKYYNKKYREDSDSMMPKLHAEINCLNQLKHLNLNYSKVKLYIYRLRKDRPHGMARPCSACLAAIKDLGIRNIYYTTDDGFVHEKLESARLGGVA